MTLFCSISFVYLIALSQAPLSAHSLYVPNHLSFSYLFSFCTLSTGNCLASIFTAKQLTLKNSLSSPDIFLLPRSTFHLPARQLQVISVLIMYRCVPYYPKLNGLYNKHLLSRSLCSSRTLSEDH